MYHSKGIYAYIPQYLKKMPHFYHYSKKLPHIYRIILKNYRMSTALFKKNYRMFSSLKDMRHCIILKKYRI